MGVETLSLVAPDDAYQYAFEEYQNMLSEWSSLQGITIDGTIPVTMDDEVSDDNPCHALWCCLLPRICEYFFHQLTQKQANDASGALRMIRAKSSKQAIMTPYKNQPRGSGNTWYNNYGCSNEEEASEA